MRGTLMSSPTHGQPDVIEHHLDAIHRTINVIFQMLGTHDLHKQRLTQTQTKTPEKPRFAGD